jgi:hypothetical protein
VLIHVKFKLKPVFDGKGPEAEFQVDSPHSDRRLAALSLIANGVLSSDMRVVYDGPTHLTLAGETASAFINEVTQ